MDTRRLANTAITNISNKNDINQVLETILEVVNALKKVNREDLIPNFIEELTNLLKNDIGAVAYVHTPLTLEKAELSEIKNKLTKRFDDEIKVVEVEDKKIIGGILIKYKDQEVDLTVNSKIRQIRQSV